MTCKAVRQLDEMYCSHCRLRWDPQFDDSPCAKASEGPPSGDLRIATFAMAILGPHSDAHIGRDTMLRLRHHKWSIMATSDERKAALAAAVAVITEIENG